MAWRSDKFDTAADMSKDSLEQTLEDFRNFRYNTFKVPLSPGGKLRIAVDRAREPDGS